MKTLFLTIRHQSVNSRYYCVTHDLSSQPQFHSTLSNRAQVGVSKLAVRTLRLELHIIFQKEVTGALYEARGVTYCSNCLILKLQELLFWSNQEFHGLDIVDTHVTDSGNNIVSNILTCRKNLIQEFALASQP